MKVLRIGLVDSLLEPSAKALRELHARVAGHLDRMDHVLFSRHEKWLETATLSDRSTAYAARCRSRAFFVPRAVIMASRLHREVGYDLVCAADPMSCGVAGLLASRRHNLPLAVVCHTDYYGGAWRALKLHHRALHPLSVRILRRADRVVAIGRHVLDGVVRLGVPRDRVSTNHALVASHLFQPVDWSLDRFAGGNLLYVGRLATEKGLTTLLRSMRDLASAGRELRLTIVGDGPLRGKLERLATDLELGARLTWAGRRPLEELPPFYQKASLILLPSIFEAQGAVLWEAALCGLPAVATTVGGIPEVVTHGETGLLVPPRDHRALAAAVARLVDDPNLAQAMGREAESRARRLLIGEDPALAYATALRHAIAR